MSCMTILSYLLATHQSRHQPQIKCAVKPVIADDHFNLPQGFCGYVWVNILTLSPVRVLLIRMQCSFCTTMFTVTLNVKLSCNVSSKTAFQLQTSNKNWKNKARIYTTLFALEMHD